jgi:hypothetical protein
MKLFIFFLIGFAGGYFFNKYTSFRQTHKFVMGVLENIKNNFKI